MDLSEALAARMAQRAGTPGGPAPGPLVEPNVNALSAALARHGVRPKEDGKNAVPWSRDLERILALPWKDLSTFPDLTAQLRRPDSFCQGCEDHASKPPGHPMELRPIQKQALWEAYQAQGLAGFIRAGDGKSGVALLLPTVLDAYRTVILTRSTLLTQMLAHDLPLWSRNFYVRTESIHLVSYEDVSDPDLGDILEKTAMDVPPGARLLVIADEAHRIRHRDTARGKRFFRFFGQRPETLFAFMSGSPIVDSIKNVGPLMDLALKDRCPVPRHWPDLCLWAGAVDPVRPGKNPTPPGALRQLCLSPAEPVRRAFRRRLNGTMGVVTSDTILIKTPIQIHERAAHAPEITAACDITRREWRLPNGDELADVLAYYRGILQQGTGFYHVRDWGKNPDGTPKPPDEYWLEAQRAWHKVVRQTLAHGARKGFDSLLLLQNAADRLVCRRKSCSQFEKQQGRVQETGPTHCATCGTALAPKWECPEWERWKRVKDRCDPRSYPVWTSGAVIQDAIAWGQELEGRGPDGKPTRDGGVIWYRHTCVGEAISKLGGFPWLGGGQDSRQLLLDLNARGLRGERVPTIVASLTAHGEGKNLQAWSKNLGVEFAGNAAALEQWLARTHRPGQKAPVVEFWMYRHIPEQINAFQTSLAQARGIQENIGLDQRLLTAEQTWKRRLQQPGHTEDGPDGTVQADLLARFMDGEDLWSGGGQ